MAELIDKDKLYKEMTEEYKKIYAGTGIGFDFTVEMQMVQTQPTTTEAEIRAKAIDEAMKKVAKTICIGCAYLKECKCTYKGGNCGVSKPMLEHTMKALEQLKAGGENV